MSSNGAPANDITDPDTTDRDAADTDTADADVVETTTIGPVELPGPEDGPPGVDSLDATLPPPTVDSRWWYWVAAAPVYFVVSLLLVGVAALVASITDVRWLFLLVAGTLFVLISIPGLALVFMFPLGLYMDARAVALSRTDWRPDPVLHGVAGLLAVWATAFVLSVPLALYYLYKRHRVVGTP